MTTYVGGTRARLISDSFFYMVRQSLIDLGWFDANRQHEAIELVRGEVTWSEPIAINTLTISDVDIDGTDAEMGSNLTNDRWTVFTDFYAEDDSLGTHVAGDLRDILRGKMPSIGRSRPILEVRDYTVVADPLNDPAPFLFNVEIEEVILDRAHNASRAWQQHWFSVRAELIDTYGDELDG